MKSTPQHRHNLDGGIQLLTKARPGPARARTGVSVLAKLNVAGILIAVVPDMPASRIDHVGHAGLLEGHASVLAPRTTEVIGSRGDIVTGSGGDGAAVEDVVGWVARRITTRG